MSRPSRYNPAVREFILEHATEEPASLGPRVTQHFGLSRSSVAHYFHRLMEEGLIQAEGNTRARRYSLKPFVNFGERIPITSSLSEDQVWREKISDKLQHLPENIRNICQYGFTEMLNNVIDHSGSSKTAIECLCTYKTTSMEVWDQGVGIFEKIRKDFHLSDPRSALLELSKGKLTSDSSRHSGEGIFFTSRMFDSFSILSGNLFYRRSRSDNEDWLIEDFHRDAYTQGTLVSMSISSRATWTLKEVFDQYSDDSHRFTKTHVPVRLGNYPGEQLVSRSQAKRVLARFENFSEVLLDFKGVETIGQAFADEIFRVFRLAHPEVHVGVLRTTPAIDAMIAHVQTPPASS